MILKIVLCGITISIIGEKIIAVFDNSRLVKHAFFLKDGEADALLYKILTEQIVM
jgi:hypothetical protein